MAAAVRVVYDSAIFTSINQNVLSIFCGLERTTLEFVRDTSLRHADAHVCSSAILRRWRAVLAESRTVALDGMPPHVGPDGPLLQAGESPQGGSAVRPDLERELNACKMKLAQVIDLISLTDKEKNGASCNTLCAHGAVSQLAIRADQPCRL